MCLEAPALAKARVVEVPDFYSASGCGADTLQAAKTALLRHAAAGDTTALLLGHNPGWEEAVALMTCQEAHDGAQAAASSDDVAPLRTAQGAMLRSEQRTWDAALEEAWTRRGEIAPPPRKTGEQIAPSPAHLAEMSDEELMSAMAKAEKALARRAKELKTNGGSTKDTKEATPSVMYTEAEFNSEAASTPAQVAADAELEKLIELVNETPSIADEQLDAWWAAQGLDSGAVQAAIEAKKAAERTSGGGKAMSAKAVAAKVSKLQKAANAASKREEKAALRSAEAAAAAELAAAVAEFAAEKEVAAAEERASRATEEEEEKSARRAATDALAAERAVAAKVDAARKAAEKAAAAAASSDAKAAKAAAREAERNASEAQRLARSVQAAAELQDAMSNDVAAAALEAACAEEDAESAPKKRSTKKAPAAAGERAAAPKASKGGAKKGGKGSSKAALKAAGASAEEEEAGGSSVARARRKAAEAAASAAWALECMRAATAE
jgi:hypothetical protein